MFYPPRRLSILFLALCLIALPALAGPVHAEATALTRVYGRVVDRTTGRPIPDAHVIVYEPPPPPYYRGIVVAKTKTDVLGNYEVEVAGEHSYEVYASCDLPSTPGFDYVPARRQISLGKSSLNVSFALLPGASINTVGDLRLFDFPSPGVTFTVIDASGLLNKTNSVTRYGLFLTIDRLLNTGGTVVVPSDTPVKVEVNASYWYVSLRFTIDRGGDYLSLAQGDQITINLRNIMIWSVVDYTLTLLESAQAVVDDAERAGFYISYERGKLSRAEILVEAARSALAVGYYDGAYADLHEAYLIIKDVMEDLPDLYANASSSVFFITPLLAFTAVVLASILLEGLRRRLVVSLALYGVLVGLLHLLFPGYTILQQNPSYLVGLMGLLFLPLWPILRYVWEFFSFLAALGLLFPLMLGASFLGALFLIHGLHRLFRERRPTEELRWGSAMAAAFSVAARNLRRRRLRTLLTSVFMLTSVFAFIMLTSFSLEYGFCVQSYPGQAPSESFLLRKPLVGERMPYIPIEPAILQWLEEQPEAALVAPKLENTPQLRIGPLATLYAPSGLSYNISGVLGVYPSLEAKVTRMDGIISQGRFLSDEDLNGILISEEAAEDLQVKPNDTLRLYGRRFNVTGIFDSGKLGGLRDLDGKPLLPQQVLIIAPGEYLTDYVFSRDVVILHAETARVLPSMVVSRVDIQTQNPGDLMDLARRAVLNWPGAEAYVSLAGGIRRLFIGAFYMASGFASSMVPLVLVALNVGVMMLSAVHERKREVAIMSTVGLNPTHVSAVFVAEALVIGVVAGSLGYFLGLTGYRLMAVFAVSLGLRQKVEAFWGILVVCLSIAVAVLGSALPAIKASVIATPSLLKRWKIKIEEMPQTAGKPWVFTMPIEIREQKLEEFFAFMEERLQGRIPAVGRIENLKVSRKEADTAATLLSFTHDFGAEGFSATENKLFPVKSRPFKQYAIRLATKTRRGLISSQDKLEVQRTASLIRRIILRYAHKYKA